MSTRTPHSKTALARLDSERTERASERWFNVAMAVTIVLGALVIGVALVRNGVF